MNAEIIKIECSYMGCLLPRCLPDHEQFEELGYNVLWPSHEEIVEFTLGGREINIHFEAGWGDDHTNVYLISWEILETNFIDQVETIANKYKSERSTVPIIVAGDNHFKNHAKAMGEAELEGRKFINQKMGDKLAREVGANKYVDFQWKAGGDSKYYLTKLRTRILQSWKMKKNDDWKMNWEQKNVVKFSSFFPFLKYHSPDELRKCDAIVSDFIVFLQCWGIVWKILEHWMLLSQE